jgi:hypothetical protein
MNEPTSIRPEATDPLADQVFAIWTEYQRTHDVTPFAGHTVGVSPETRGVYFGRTFADAEASAAAAGVTQPLVFVRVGKDEEIRRRHRLGGRWRRAN